MMPACGAHACRRTCSEQQPVMILCTQPMQQKKIVECDSASNGTTVTAAGLRMAIEDLLLKVTVQSNDEPEEAPARRAVQQPGGPGRALAPGARPARPRC